MEIDSRFQALDNLLVLDASQNFLMKVDDALTGCEKLQDLNLADNILEDLDIQIGKFYISYSNSI